MQDLSAPAIAMLLAVLVDQKGPGAEVWWAVSVFHGRFGLSPATRARGTRELVREGLLRVKRAPVTTSKGRNFAADRVRNVYSVAGAAKLRVPVTSKVGANFALKPTPPPPAASGIGIADPFGVVPSP
jgi:hypothetical protein